MIDCARCKMNLAEIAFKIFHRRIQNPRNSVASAHRSMTHYCSSEFDKRIGNTISLPKLNLIWLLSRPGIHVDFGLQSTGLVIIDSHSRLKGTEGR